MIQNGWTLYMMFLRNLVALRACRTLALLGILNHVETSCTVSNYYNIVHCILRLYYMHVCMCRML